VQPRETVLVLGAGPIGLAGMLMARHAGARVLITDVNQQRLDFARRLGADEVYRADQVDIGEAVREATGGSGADATIEAVGGAQDQTILDAVAATSTRGRIVVLGTFAKGPQSIPAYVFKNREQTLMGSHGHPGSFAPTIDLVARKEIHPLDLITQRLGLAEVERAFAMLDSQADGVVKIVIEQ
jgi:threonine dehydrogenase-like Zn-dependent dehydrogenase